MLLAHQHAFFEGANPHLEVEESLGFTVLSYHAQTYTYVHLWPLCSLYIYGLQWRICDLYLFSMQVLRYSSFLASMWNQKHGWNSYLFHDLLGSKGGWWR